jgi:hypothetical protein
MQEHKYVDVQKDEQDRMPSWREGLCTKIFVSDIELQRSSQIGAQGCFNPGEYWFPEILNSVGVGELLQSSSGVLSLSQGWKPWAEIGKRLWRSTFVQSH